MSVKVSSLFACLWTLYSIFSPIQGDALRYVNLDDFQALQRTVQAQASTITELDARLTALTNRDYAATSPPATACGCETLQTKLDQLNDVRVDMATLQDKVSSLEARYGDVSSLRQVVDGLSAKVVDLATLEAKVASLSQRAGNLDSLESQVNNLRVNVATLRAKTSSLGDLQVSVFQLRDKVSNISTTAAFSATYSADDPTNGVYLPPHSILTFDNAITNIGRAYDPTTGKFTASAPGTYAFSLHMMVPNAGGHVELGIMKEGVVLDLAWAPDTGDLEDQGSTQVTTHLDAGDQVWVQLQSGNSVRGSYWTVFTGFLVQAE